MQCEAVVASQCERRGPHMSWWVYIDFGTDHTVIESDEPPAIMGLDGRCDGPFATFTEARKFILSVGTTEIAQMQDRQRWWRTASKAEILRSQ